MKIIVTKSTIKQRNGEDPDIQVTRTQFIPEPRFKKPKTKGKKKPIDYGVTQNQFHQILDKASQPINNKAKERNDDGQRKNK